MTTMTEKQRQAVEALEAARQVGVTLTAYAKGKGLVIGELYSTLAGLRRKGLLARPTRKPHSKFVAVRVEAPPPILGRVPGSGAVVCRVVHVDGCVIECAQWPPAELAERAEQGAEGCCGLIAVLNGCTCTVRRWT
jgi:hypothetical protein